jgi:acyl-CoA synthetase (NDP forming)/RimJ/RimL family protein N-acetyltransferase
MPLVRDVILRDGSVLRLREPTADDEAAIKDFFDRLDPESRYLRFHGHIRSDRVAAHYGAADGENRVALLAHREGEIVAVAGYERLRELGAAEVAFAVLASEQGRGLGTRMLEQLAAVASEHGIDRFDASVLIENRRMLRVFSSAGFAVKRESSYGVVELSMDIRPSETLAERIAERDHQATVASLRPLLAPSSLAVVGASNQPDSVGGRLFANVLAARFSGIATPVNRASPVVQSVRAHPRVSEMPEPPELAILAVPAAEVLDVARDATGAGVHALIVVSAGFAERDDEGRRRQDELLDLCRDHGVRLIGPNSLGLINTDAGVALNAAMSQVSPPPGRLAISSQSGALGIGLLGQAVGRGLGVASFVTLGNRADVSTNDLLEWWEDDERVAVIALYMESFGNPRRFSVLARRVSRRKPIVAVKGHRDAGLGDGGGSRTAGALRGEAVFDALFRQAGVLRVEGAQALFDTAALLERQPLPGGRSVAVVTNSGGLGTLAADACLSRGLSIAPLSPATKDALAAALPDADRTTNPVDLGISATPDHLRAAVDTVLGDEGVDAAIVLTVDLAGVSPDAMLAALEPAGGNRAKPVAASCVRADGRTPAPPGSVPNFRFPEACAAVLALAAERREWLSRPLGQRPAFDEADADAARARVAAALGDDDEERWLPSEDVAALLGAYGIPTAADASGEGVEVLAGAVNHQALGVVTGVGAGGPQAGVYGDVAFRLSPATDVDAAELLGAAPVVAQWLAAGELDRDALADCVLRLTRLFEDVPELVEGDLNPVRVHADGVTVLDARLRAGRRSAPERIRTW